MSGGSNNSGSKGSQSSNYTYRSVPGNNSVGNWNTGGGVVGRGDLSSGDHGSFQYAPGYNGPRVTGAAPPPAPAVTPTGKYNPAVADALQQAQLTINRALAKRTPSIVQKLIPPAPQADDVQMRPWNAFFNSLDQSTWDTPLPPMWNGVPSYDNPTNPSDTQFGPRNPFNANNNTNAPNNLNNYNITPGVNTIKWGTPSIVSKITDRNDPGGVVRW